MIQMIKPATMKATIRVIMNVMGGLYYVESSVSIAKIPIFYKGCSVCDILSR